MPLVRRLWTKLNNWWTTKHLLDQQMLWWKLDDRWRAFGGLDPEDPIHDDDQQTVTNKETTWDEAATVADKESKKDGEDSKLKNLNNEWVEDAKDYHPLIWEYLKEK